MIKKMIEAAREAGKAIMEVRETGILGEREKSDGSPVGIADRESERIIKEFLKEFTIPVVSEESFSGIPDGEFFLVDPLDGTKEFMRGLDEFTVNIAYVKGFMPVLGVVYAPALNSLYWSDGNKSYRNGEEISVSNSVSVVVSRSHLSEEMEKTLEMLKERLGEMKISRIGSSLKGCMVAEGKAGAYLRITPLMIWDAGAMHAIVRDAGGCVTDWYGKDIDYSSPRIMGLRVTNCSKMWKL